MADLLSERSRLLVPTPPLRAHELGPLTAAVSTADVLDVMEITSQLADRAQHTVADRDLVDRLDVLVAAGGVSALAAIELLGALIGDDADERLVTLLGSDDPVLRRHASWRLGRRSAVRRAVPTLVHELQRGGIDTFHAHRTLRAWSAQEPALVLRATTTALAVTDDAASRARLVDLVGAVQDRGTDAYLVDLAVDDDEPDAVRIAAIGALGDRRSPMIIDALSSLASSDDVIGAHAALALEAGALPTARAASTGLRVAQLVLTEGLDVGLSRGGRGETGGVASLLVSLAGALGAQPSVEHVLTIGRGTVHEALLDPFGAASASSYGTIAIGDPSRPVTGSPDAWEHVPALERGIRRAIRLAGGVDVLHLRMADAATLIGFECAAAGGIATCFSLAPDPHHVIQSLQRRGELDAQNLERLEAEQHLWLRARLIEQIGRSADRVAMFPRVARFAFMDRMGTAESVDGIRPNDDGSARRSAVVAEGIDLAPIRHAESTPGASPSVIDDLVLRLPAGRRNLPLLVTVGRLHPVKGIERVVAAWSREPLLRDHCNLVIVGGDLDEPSPVERSVVDAIERVIDERPRCRDGVVMLGGRPHADVARLLVSAASGRSGAWAAGGVYVDGALKEEFGLAVLEALAAGLPVVAPSTGGPATYVTGGDMGVLVDPGDDLSVAIRDAFDLVPRPGRANRARTLVEANYSVDAMAEQLVGLYRGCSR